MNYSKDFERDNVVAKKMKLAALQADRVASGQQRACYFSGPPGVGKSRAIRDAVAQFRATGRPPLYCNPANYQDTVKAFIEAARGKRPIVFEEADALFQSQRQINIFKLATSDNPEERVRNDVRLDSPIMVSTNSDLSDLTRWPKPLRVHIEALFNRVAPVVIPSDPDALYEYSVGLALHHGLLSADRHGNGLSLDVRVRALQWFTANSAHLRSVSPRTLQNIAYSISSMHGEARRAQLSTLLVNGAEETPCNDDIDWMGLICAATPGRSSLVVPS